MTRAIVQIHDNGDQILRNHPQGDVRRISMPHRTDRNASPEISKVEDIDIFAYQELVPKEALRKFLIDQLTKVSGFAWSNINITPLGIKKGDLVRYKLLETEEEE